MAHATVIQLDVALPPLTGDYKAPTFSSISAPSTSGAVYPAGPAFHTHARRILNQRSFADDDRLEKERLDANGNGEVVEDDADAGLGDEEEDRDLLEMDPKRWKDQDHYAVLGLQHLRYKANDEQIKKAHRRKVLRHHPDKKANATKGGSMDDSFFKCIAKAMEILSNPEKRRQFDSVDPAVPDEFPTAAETTAENFYDLWAPVFEREGRFSKRQPVPSLGGPDSSKQEVESFYDFFYNIDSWRSFEYDDKDVAEGADSRDEKRHQEKKNKAERDRKKKEDNTRRRTLVDQGLALDPRIKQFRAAEKAAREAKRRGGAGAPATLDPAQQAEQEKKAKELAEAEAAATAAKEAADKADRELQKKAKAAAAKEVKKNKKAISNAVAAHNYFTVAGTSPAPATIEACFLELDLLFGAFEPEEVAALKAQVDGKSADEAKAALVAAAKQAEAKVGEGKFKEFA
ncbi:Zuotin [Rhodotorula kratochvilovae]